MAVGEGGLRTRRPAAGPYARVFWFFLKNDVPSGQADLQQKINGPTHARLEVRRRLSSTSRCMSKSDY